jgi:cytochrome c
MSMVTRAFTSMAVACLIAALGFAGGTASAAPPASKDEAVAMVKKAVAYIKTEGPDKAYPAIDDQAGQFVDRDLYVVVYGLDGKVLAHGADKARIGTNQIDAKDPDGKAFVKERVELALTQPSFWQGYKFMNPVSKKVEPKQMYCERFDATVVCAGIYQL